MRNRYPKIPTKDLERLIEVVRRLRHECPWDRQQTHQSIRHSLLEETYEVIEALDDNDINELKKELGDLLLHIIMHVTMAEQTREFTLQDVVREITEKLIRRHPHVFGSHRVRDAEEVTHNWEKIKMDEGRTSILDGVPKSLPALLRAAKVQGRAAKVGFEWRKKSDVWKKVEEEHEELQRAVRGNSKRKREEELGDYLFALVNYARFIDVNPEDALRSTVDKFMKRFRFIERELRKQGKDIHHSTLEEMDGLWNQAKRKKGHRW
ncbi:MAG: nucleoside triphosphate pyrophosphohydrolase [Ignavibacteriae bacterium]|nr:nucleoside triphosphate pyrophosphohydrolase [Ignavibacteriota bacterium]